MQRSRRVLGQEVNAFNDSYSLVEINGSTKIGYFIVTIVGLSMSRGRCFLATKCPTVSPAESHQGANRCFSLNAR